MNWKEEGKWVEGQRCEENGCDLYVFTYVQTIESILGILDILDSGFMNENDHKEICQTTIWNIDKLLAL